MQSEERIDGTKIPNRRSGQETQLLNIAWIKEGQSEQQITKKCHPETGRRLRVEEKTCTDKRKMSRSRLSKNKSDVAGGADEAA